MFGQEVPGVGMERPIFIIYRTCDWISLNPIIRYDPTRFQGFVFPHRSRPPLPTNLLKGRELVI